MPKKPTRPLKHQLIYFITESETKCAYCGRRYDDEKTKKTMDHVVPKSKGGETSLANIIICCQNCNVKKGNEDMDVFIKQNKRVKANLLKYFDKIEECIINNKSYHKALHNIYSMIKK